MIMTNNNDINEKMIMVIVMCNGVMMIIITIMII